MLTLSRALVVLTCIGSAITIPTHSHESESTSWEKFSILLDTVDEGALHRVLHAVYPKFQDGVFSKDRTAVEQVHSENPVVASKLLHIAKRQSSNDTITSSTTTTSFSSTTDSPTTPPPTSATTSSSPQDSSQAQASSSEAAVISSVLSSVLSNEVTATFVPSPTTVFIVPSTPASATPIRTESAGVVFSSSGGLVTLSSSAVNVRFTQSTRTNTYYTTLPDGSRQTRTSVVVVNAPVTEGASSPSSTSAGLQNGSGKVANNGLTGLILGALGVIAAL